MDNKKLASTNVTFEFLYNSKDFMNIILNKVPCCVILLNKDMELQAFNDPIKSLFMDKEDEHLLYVRCGEAIGCAYTIEEMKDCGKTSKCEFCELRIKAVEAYVERKPIYKNKISREFYNVKGEKKMKHLKFSVLPFYFQNDYYIILIIEDISCLIELNQKLLEN